jgi:isopentenyl diphosphate isomerase/L-lactate dehydrogenase-like FMN-dependent dehydrogenase
MLGMPILPAGAVLGVVVITADGGSDRFDGLDAALGADFVMIGREMIRAAIGGGAEGVQLELNFLLQDLRKAMIMTSCNSIAEITERIFA